MDTIEIEGNTYKVSGYAEDGLPIIKAKAISKQDGFDKDGNPIISTTITVPTIGMGAEPGTIGE